MISYPRLRPRWGLIDCAVIFVVIFVYSVLFGLYGYPLVNRVLLLFPIIGSFEAAFLITAGFLQSILIILLVIISVLLRKAPLAAIGLRRCSWNGLFVYGIGGGIAVLFLVAVVMSLIISFFPQPPQPQPIAELILNAQDWRQVVLLLLLVSVLAPVSEEMFFRGFIYPVLRFRFSIVGGIVISACLFGAMHLDLVRFLPLALGGACLTLFCEKSASIYPAMIAHSMWNTVMTLLALFFNLVL